jgi:anti-sigma factor RsiW
MDHKAELKLQAALDGELSETDAREVASWLARDQEAVLLQAELRNTRQALASAERPIVFPESRDFFWSKIQREIERQEKPVAVKTRPSFFAAWQRMLIPAGAIAALAIAVLVTLGPPTPATSTDVAESSHSDAGAFTYHDYDAHATLVWLSYPAEDDLADAAPADTVQ